MKRIKKKIVATINKIEVALIKALLSHIYKTRRRQIIVDVDDHYVAIACICARCSVSESDEIKQTTPRRKSKSGVSYKYKASHYDEAEIIHIPGRLILDPVDPETEARREERRKKKYARAKAEINKNAFVIPEANHADRNG